MAVEGKSSFDGVAEDQDERMRHRPGRGQSRQPRAGRRRCTDASPDDRGVIEHVGDVGMDVPCPEADHGLGRGDVDDLPGRGGPAGRLRKHPEERGLVQPEPAVARADAQHDLARRDPIAVRERLDLRLRRVAIREDVTEQVLRLIDATQHRFAAREDLHRDERIETLGVEDALGPCEVDVGGVAGQDLVARVGLAGYPCSRARLLVQAPSERPAPRVALPPAPARRRV